MKLATFNCNGVRARIDAIRSWLATEKPDILLLQEIKVETGLFPREPFEELKYNILVQGKKGHAGVAILSKKEPDEVNYGFRDGDDTEYSRLMSARWGQLNVINSYVPQGRDREHEQFGYKLEWFRRFREYMDDYYKSKELVVWAGDFNVAPEEIDVYNSARIMGHVAHCEEVFKALEDVREWGFIDLFRKLHSGEEGHYSYWDYRFPGMFDKNQGWRVDHIWATKAVVDKARSCWIDRKPREMEKPSDHTFVVAELDF